MIVILLDQRLWFLKNINFAGPQLADLPARIRDCKNPAELVSLFRLYGKFPQPFPVSEATKWKIAKDSTSDDCEVKPIDHITEGYVLVGSHSMIGETGLAAIADPTVHMVSNAHSMDFYRFKASALKDTAGSSRKKKTVTGTQWDGAVVKAKDYKACVLAIREVFEKMESQSSTPSRSDKPTGPRLLS